MKTQEIIREQSLENLNTIIANYNNTGYVIMPGSLQLITTTKTNFWIVIMERDIPLTTPYINSIPSYDSSQRSLVLNVLTTSGGNKIHTIKQLRESTREVNQQGETTYVMGLKEAKDIVDDIISKHRPYMK
jgi:ribosomal protein L7/L12